MSVIIKFTPVCYNIIQQFILKMDLLHSLWKAVDWGKLAGRAVLFNLCVQRRKPYRELCVRVLVSSFLAEIHEVQGWLYGLGSQTADPVHANAESERRVELWPVSAGCGWEREHLPGGGEAPARSPVPHEQGRAQPGGNATFTSWTK